MYKVGLEIRLDLVVLAQQQMFATDWLAVRDSILVHAPKGCVWNTVFQCFVTESLQQGPEDLQR